MADKEEGLVVEGTVVECLRSSKFRIAIDNDGEQSNHLVLATLAGKMRKNYIRVVNGDKVRVELSPYDLERGRIVYRHK